MMAMNKGLDAQGNLILMTPEEEASFIKYQETQEVQAPSLEDTLLAAFATLPDDARGVFWPLREGIKGALLDNDLAAAKKLVELSLIPEAFEPYRIKFLALLGG